MPGGDVSDAAADTDPSVVTAEHLQTVLVKPCRRCAIGAGGGPGRPALVKPAGGTVGPEAGGRLQPFNAELRLRRGDGGLHQRERMRSDGFGPSGNIHDAEHRAGIRIVQRNGGAAPGVDHSVEVLRAGDLNAMIKCQCGARCTGADPGFRPVRAGHEHHPLGLAAHAFVAVDPQQPAVLIAHGDQQSAVISGADQQLMNHRHDRGQRMLLTVLGQLAAVVHQFRIGCIRVGMVAQRSFPGIADDAPKPGDTPDSGTESLVGLIGMLLNSVRIESGRNRKPWVRRRSCASSVRPPGNGHSGKGNVHCCSASSHASAP